MDSSLLIPLTSIGTAGIFCILFVLGWVFPKSVVDDLKAERDFLRQRVEAERERADTAVAAAQATKDVFAALQASLSFRNERQDDRSVMRERPPPELQSPGST